MRKYPINVEQEIQKSKEYFGDTFDALSEELLRLILEGRNEAYEQGRSDGPML